MIDELDRTMERWLRAVLSLGSGTADIGFDAPERDWNARRSIPLLNLFLYSVIPSASRAANGTATFERDGAMFRTQHVPIVEARYLVSVWGGSAGVEHELLGRVMNVLATSKGIPSEYLSDTLRAAQSMPLLSLQPDEVTTTTQLWSALGVPPRAALQLLVSLPAGLAVAVRAADPPTSLHLSTNNRRQPAALSQRRRQFGRADPSMAGRLVVSRRGSAIIQDSGRYSVEADPDDVIEVVVPDAPSEHG